MNFIVQIIYQLNTLITPFPSFPGQVSARFARPTPAPAWSGVYEATRYQFACVQHRYPIEATVNRRRGLSTGSSAEDCLYLNLFAPEPETGNFNRSSRAVMVFFYGGSFEGGTIFDSVYDGRVLATEGEDGGVLVVTVNYRLSAFGFLYGGTEEAPGNGGLYDQILALKWLQDNLPAFGGDPRRVTIFGQSAGSMSASALILSPLAKGLFSRAILQSGVVSSYFGANSAKVALEKALTLAEKVGCLAAGSLNSSSHLPHSLIVCLQEKSAQEILKHGSGGMMNGESFVPTFGTELLPISPVEALKTGAFNHLDGGLVYGVTRDEGVGFLAAIFPAFKGEKHNENDHPLTVQSAHTLVKLLFQMVGERRTEEVADFYTKHLSNATSQEVLRRTVAQAFADYHIVCPTVLFGEAVAAAKTLPSSSSSSAEGRHQHNFYSYRVMLPTSVGLMGCKGEVVCHGEDLIYVFAIAQQLRGVVFSEEEYRLSRDMVRLWTSFVSTGTPGAVGANGTMEWARAVSSVGSPSSPPKYTRHLALDPRRYQMIDDYYREVCNGFWKPRMFG